MPPNIVDQPLTAGMVCSYPAMVLRVRFNTVLAGIVTLFVSGTSCGLATPYSHRPAEVICHSRRVCLQMTFLIHRT